MSELKKMHLSKTSLRLCVLLNDCSHAHARIVSEVTCRTLVAGLLTYSTIGCIVKQILKQLWRFQQHRKKKLSYHI